MPPQLYIVPTPIGNLADITLRAIDILKNVDKILAEDTRKSGLLLKHLNIKKPLQSYHNANEHKVAEKIIDALEKGTTMALISDAGTPAISDPGFFLVRACLEKNISIECLPGPTAFIPALVKSGFPTDRFIFEGFLPHKKGRKTRIKQLIGEKRTTILYESPHRLIKTLEQIKEILGNQRHVSVSRELTKIHEETIIGTPDEIITYFSEKAIKGEFVLVIEGDST